MGGFCTQPQARRIDKDSNGHRRYRITLRLSPQCAHPDVDTLLMEIEAIHGYVDEASIGEIAIRKQPLATPLFAASGWNTDRESPCHGMMAGAAGSCVEIALAQAYKQLAYVAYTIRRKMTSQEAAAFARRIPVPDFADKVERYCGKRSANRGVGAWPMVHSGTCQAERITAKVHELQAWSECRSSPQRACRMPDQRFDR